MKEGEYVIRTRAIALAIAALAATSVAASSPAAAQTTQRSTTPAVPVSSQEAQRAKSDSNLGQQVTTFNEVTDVGTGLRVYLDPAGQRASVTDIPFNTRVTVVCYALNHSQVPGSYWYLIAGTQPWNGLWAIAGLFGNQYPASLSHKYPEQDRDPAVAFCTEAQLQE